MGRYNGAVITTAGQNVLSQAISGTMLTWTAMKTSSSAIPEGTDLTTLTALTNVEQTSGITDASVYGNNVIQISARFSNTNILSAYYIRTVGIYGQLEGGNETLIAVMTAITPDEMPVYDPDAPSAFIFNVQITVQEASTVTMEVNDTGTATVADLNQIRVDISDRASKETLQELDTPVRITIAVTDWTASGANYSCTKSCSKATEDDYCVLRLVPVNPGTLTAAQLKTLQKNVALLYPQATVGNGTITFLASALPAISLSFDVVGGAVS